MRENLTPNVIITSSAFFLAFGLALLSANNLVGVSSLLPFSFLSINALAIYFIVSGVCLLINRSLIWQVFWSSSFLVYVFLAGVYYYKTENGLSFLASIFVQYALFLNIEKAQRSKQRFIK